MNQLPVRVFSGDKDLYAGNIGLDQGDTIKGWTNYATRSGVSWIGPLFYPQKTNNENSIYTVQRQIWNDKYGDNAERFTGRAGVFRAMGPYDDGHFKAHPLAWPSNPLSERFEQSTLGIFLAVIFIIVVLLVFLVKYSLKKQL